MENTVAAKIVSIEEVMNLNLEIPNYQRPYRWETENVRQMLEDILYSMESKKQNYRIGSVILHKENGIYYIVDGQQRLTTLYLLKSVCGKEIDEKFRYFVEKSKELTRRILRILLTCRQFVNYYII